MKRVTKMTMRTPDRWGAGYFGAPRGDHKHNGIDLVCSPDDIILSPVSGQVTKVGYPYDPKGPKGGYRYVEVTTPDRHRHRVFYINPMVDVGSTIAEGAPLGASQDLGTAYPGITQHTHYEIKLPTGEYLDPTPFV